MSKITMITLEKLLEMKANEDEFVLVDTLDKESFNEGHLPGAINLPSESIIGEADEKLGKQDTIVTYCAGYDCPASTIAARKLLDTGFSDVLDFKGGLEAWANAGLEVET